MRSVLPSKPHTGSGARPIGSSGGAETPQCRAPGRGWDTLQHPAAVECRLLSPGLDTVMGPRGPGDPPAPSCHGMQSAVTRPKYCHGPQGVNRAADGCPGGVGQGSHLMVGFTVLHTRP